MPQLTYSYDGAAAVAGMLADEAPKEVITRVAGEALDFGVAVIADPANPGKVKVPTDDTGNIVGIVVFVPTIQQRMDGGKPIQANMEVAILRKGSIWAAAALAASTPAELETIKIHNGADATKRGKVTGEAAATNSVRTLAGRATFRDKPAAASTLVKVELNLP